MKIEDHKKAAPFIETMETLVSLRDKLMQGEKDLPILIQYGGTMNGKKGIILHPDQINTTNVRDKIWTCMSDEIDILKRTIEEI